MLNILPKKKICKNLMKNIKQREVKIETAKIFKFFISLLEKLQREFF